MDPPIIAAARALAAIGASKRIVLRDDAPALALRELGLCLCPLLYRGDNQRRFDHVISRSLPQSICIG
jgi:hypothetical protein